MEEHICMRGDEHKCRKSIICEQPHRRIMSHMYSVSFTSFYRTPRVSFEIYVSRDTKAPILADECTRRHDDRRVLSALDFRKMVTNKNGKYTYTTTLQVLCFTRAEKNVGSEPLTIYSEANPHADIQSILLHDSCDYRAKVRVHSEYDPSRYICFGRS